MIARLIAWWRLRRLARRVRRAGGIYAVHMLQDDGTWATIQEGPETEAVIKDIPPGKIVTVRVTLGGQS